jgi:hypothetical protein
MERNLFILLRLQCGRNQAESVLVCSILCKTSATLPARWREIVERRAAAVHG